MGKKNRKAIAKRRVQTRQKRKQRREKDKVSQRGRAHSSPWPQPDAIVGRPAMADVGAPEGFRSIGMS